MHCSVPPFVGRMHNGVLSQATLPLHPILQLKQGGKRVSHELLPIDITLLPELSRLVDEIERTGVGRVLVRDGEEVALLTPARARSQRQSASKRPRKDPARVLNIIGLGASGVPGSIARNKDEYIADAIRRTSFE
jgi:antitoxin (DNA-binding transcriptional repressor) of toxin-antitoxin stability system